MLIRWIRNRLRARRRLIFRFWDGSQIRGADPVIVATRLHEHTSYLHQHLFDTAQGDTEALAIVASAACDAFDVSELRSDGKAGLTRSELYELMVAFDQYMLALKKNTATSPISQASTDATSTPSSEATTSDSLGSGSIDDDPTSGKAKSTDSAI